jgi:hypothetical protein
MLEVQGGDGNDGERPAARALGAMRQDSNKLRGMVLVGWEHTSCQEYVAPAHTAANRA